MLTLLELLDLDPNLTLKSDLDTLDPGIVCMHCFDRLEPESSLDIWHFTAFTWKECVSISRPS